MNRLTALLVQAVRPRFLNPPDMAYRGVRDYRRVWFLSIAGLAAVSLIPLLILTLTDYQLTRKALQLENTLRLVRIASNTRRTVTHFLEERISALHFVLEEETYDRLRSPGHLEAVLKNLKVGFGGVVDLGLINADGVQAAYAGPFELIGKNYVGQPWLQEVRAKGAYVSDMFLGFRGAPHIVAAVASDAAKGRGYFLRSTLDMERLINLLSILDLGASGDAFLINRQGVLQTPSKFFGKVLDNSTLKVPPYSEHTQSAVVEDPERGPILVGYAYIKDSPFILMVTRQQAETMRAWMDIRLDLIWFLVASITVLLFAIYAISTYMGNSLYEADVKQATAMSHMESTNRLASLGRLSAGVAHEINNPLAVINEKAGLIKDLLELDPKYNADERLIGHLDSVLDSVDRCGRITKQMLGFAREGSVEIQPFSLDKVVRDVLSFFEKEAVYRSIDVNVAVAPSLPDIRSDRGKLMQVLLNIVGNAFQAMRNGDSLNVTAEPHGEDRVKIRIQDTGAGISKENMKQIFEPFFTTKSGKGGSGLGLSITYGLVRKLQGAIDVQSEEGAGAAFTIDLPLTIREVRNDESAAG
ncbi:MAG: two-component system, NtrC family, sensor kinase [Desulfovibrionales bacterium]|nr:two-component system, NtrC family, sensor kinase [Desulfovibrionales bacterium]